MNNGDINAPFLFTAIFSLLAVFGMVLLFLTLGARTQQPEPSNNPASPGSLSTARKGPEHHPEEVVAIKRKVLDTLDKTERILGAGSQ